MIKIAIEFESGNAMVSINDDSVCRLSDVVISIEEPEEPDWEKSYKSEQAGAMFYKLTGEYVLTVKGKKEAV